VYEFHLIKVNATCHQGGLHRHEVLQRGNGLIQWSYT